MLSIEFHMVIIFPGVMLPLINIVHSTESNCCARQYCGPARPFSMSILDNNQQEVIHLERPYRCSAWCCFCCLQKMEVQSPPGTVIGYVEQVSLCVLFDIVHI